jgi:predicted GIY-YIG superfamily endonuclease
VYVYILRCSDGSYYIGHTVDLAARERTHNEGHGARFTAARRPVEIVYAEEWPNTIAAIRRERQLKRWSTAKKNALVVLETRTLKDLARRRA